MTLYAATISLSAFLLFLVQPIVAKQILPWFGGSAAVWTTCVFFFQFLLLAGYAYAHALVRYLAPRPQLFVHLALLGASLALLPIVADAGWKPSGGEERSAAVPARVVEAEDEGDEVDRERRYPQERDRRDILREVIGDGEQQARAHRRQGNP